MISAPEDYGLTEAQTRAFVNEAPPPELFEPFWRQWREMISETPLRLDQQTVGERRRVVYESLRGVRIVGQLTMPEGRPRGAVLTTHGYAAPDAFEDQPEPWSELGLATLRVRVRGYPPSTLDIDDLRGQWILHNIHSADGWIAGGAVADVVQGVRALRGIFDERMAITLHGESFGGGLAAIAAAQLTLLHEPPARLVLELPSFGAWRWRDGKYCNGAGGLVNMLLDSRRGDERQRLLDVLDLFDAAHHARVIHCPAFFKLALRDDVVPAPSAWAIFNALESREKWAFEVRYGHFDGGIADSRRHAMFQHLHPAFADPARLPKQVVADARMRFHEEPAAENERK